MNKSGDYHQTTLSASRLKQVYDIAPVRVQQYLKAETDHIIQHIDPDDQVLELGCGYGRILPFLAQRAGFVIGIDTSFNSLRLGREILAGYSNIRFLQMDAIQLAFSEKVFDCVVCIQNGISAFHIDQRQLIEESIRVTKPGGVILFSSYSDTFWDDRLEWFRLQSKSNLVGEIDESRTGNGVIVCKDGFTATTITSKQFRFLTQGLHVETHIVEVDGSSLFCEMIKKGAWG